MKIFNWVHKRFQRNGLQDGFGSNMKKTEPELNIADSQTMLKQVALTDLLDGWKDGILTIGTLGYDPLKSINHHKEYFALGDPQDGVEGQDIVVDDDVENCYSTEQEELNPLMHNTFKHNLEAVVSANHEASAGKEEVVNEIFEVSQENDVDSDQKKKGERITLADLFLADSDSESDSRLNMKLDSAKVLHESSEKQSLKGISFAKKLIPRVKDNPHPMKDIKKLMKKMLKRKIHPDLDVKNNKPVGQEVSPAGIADHIHKNEGNVNSTYFLPI